MLQLQPSIGPLWHVLLKVSKIEDLLFSISFVALSTIYKTISMKKPREMHGQLQLMLLIIIFTFTVTITDINNHMQIRLLDTYDGGNV